MTAFVAANLAATLCAMTAWARQRARTARAEARLAKYRRWVHNLTGDRDILRGLPVTYDCPEAER